MSVSPDSIPDFQNTEYDLYSILMFPFIVYANGYHSNNIVQSLVAYINKEGINGDIVMYRHECHRIKINEFLPFVIGLN